jgi:hypothetical protein
VFIIIWRRWGPVGLLFLVLGFLIWVGLGAVIRAASGITATTGWYSVIALVIGFGIGAVANWLFAVRVVEPKLDRPGAVPPVPSSTLFFMPLRWWSIAILVVGVVFLVPNLIAALSS